MQVEMNALALFAGAGGYAMKKIADPSLTYVGNRVRDLLFDRAAEADEVGREAAEILADKGLQPSVVPGRIFWPIVEFASMDSKGELRRNWAAMLANESAAPGSVHPSYPHILSQLEPSEVAVLDFMLRRLARSAQSGRVELSDLMRFSRDLDHMKRMIRNLARLDVAVPTLHGSGFDHLDYGMIESQGLAFSSLGLDFIRSCVADDPSMPPAPEREQS